MSYRVPPNGWRLSRSAEGAVGSSRGLARVLNRMGKFLESEKLRQAEFKASSPYFSNAARADGVYKGKLRPFCLPVEYAEENLFPEVRGAALAYFASQGIKWHDGQSGKPSNHLCDS